MHRQVVYRLLPERRRVWRRLEHLLEAQRQLYNAALDEKIGASGARPGCRSPGRTSSGA